MSTFRLKVVTPTKGFFEGDVDGASVRTTEGDVGILSGHTQYVAAVGTGPLKIKQDGKTRVAAVSGGFLQVGKQETTLITISCEWVDEIDLEKAKQEETQAETLLKDSKSDEEKASARNALKRARNKIKLRERQA